MRARHGLVYALLLNFRYAHTDGHIDAVEPALGHMEDMLRLCRKNNMGIRSITPPLYVALETRRPMTL